MLGGGKLNWKLIFKYLFNFAENCPLLLSRLNGFVIQYVIFENLIENQCIRDAVFPMLHRLCTLYTGSNKYSDLLLTRIFWRETNIQVQQYFWIFKMPEGRERPSLTEYCVLIHPCIFFKAETPSIFHQTTPFMLARAIMKSQNEPSSFETLTAIANPIPSKTSIFWRKIPNCLI